MRLKGFFFATIPFVLEDFFVFSLCFLKYSTLHSLICLQPSYPWYCAKKSSRTKEMVAENSHLILSCFMEPGPCELNTNTRSYTIHESWKAHMYMGTHIYLKSQCHPKCFARRGTFFIYEKYAIFLIVMKSDLYLLPSLPLAIRKH